MTDFSNFHFSIFEFTRFHFRYWFSFGINWYINLLNLVIMLFDIMGLSLSDIKYGVQKKNSNIIMLKGWYVIWEYVNLSVWNLIIQFMEVMSFNTFVIVHFPVRTSCQNRKVKSPTFKSFEIIEQIR